MKKEIQKFKSQKLESKMEPKWKKTLKITIATIFSNSFKDLKKIVAIVIFKVSFHLGSIFNSNFWGDPRNQSLPLMISGEISKPT